MVTEAQNFRDAYLQAMGGAYILRAFDTDRLTPEQLLLAKRKGFDVDALVADPLSVLVRATEAITTVVTEDPQGVANSAYLGLNVTPDGKRTVTLTPAILECLPDLETRTLDPIPVTVTKEGN